MDRQTKKWRIFKERVSPYFTDCMWAVWSPSFEETLFNSHAEAIDYVNRKIYYELAKRHLTNLKETT